LRFERVQPTYNDSLQIDAIVAFVDSVATLEETVTTVAAASSTPAQFGSAIAAAVRAKGAAIGMTVPASQVWLPTFSKL
jgi:hypothetical protein